MFIRSTGNISAQNSFGDQPFLSKLVPLNGNRMTCLEPDYKSIIDPKLIRRMSRIIRMGVAAALECVNRAGIEKPDAIVTGTAYGCLEDTGLFLGRMIEFEETLLNPTAFIQSTHNTIGAQIALLLNCNNYNNAFVHRGFSFQSALLDAMMLINEGDAANVLVGSVDEITEISHTILSRFNLYKNATDFENAGTSGTIAGEGASFFLLTKHAEPESLAKIRALETLYKPENELEVQHWINKFLVENDIQFNQIDLIITGGNADVQSNDFFNRLQTNCWPSSAVMNYKNLCGEYPTAISFACWLAAKIIKQGNLPNSLMNTLNLNNPVKKILIVDQYQGIHNSLLLLEAC